MLAPLVQWSPWAIMWAAIITSVFLSIARARAICKGLLNFGRSLRDALPDGRTYRGPTPLPAHPPHACNDRCAHRGRPRGILSPSHDLLGHATVAQGRPRHSGHDVNRDRCRSGNTDPTRIRVATVARAACMARVAVNGGIERREASHIPEQRSGTCICARVVLFPPALPWGVVRPLRAQVIVQLVEVSGKDPPCDPPESRSVCGSGGGTLDPQSHTVADRRTHKQRTVRWTYGRKTNAHVGTRTSKRSHADPSLVARPAFRGSAPARPWQVHWPDYPLVH